MFLLCLGCLPSPSLFLGLRRSRCVGGRRTQACTRMHTTQTCTTHARARTPSKSRAPPWQRHRAVRASTQQHGLRCALVRSVSAKRFMAAFRPLGDGIVAKVRIFQPFSVIVGDSEAGRAPKFSKSAPKSVLGPELSHKPRELCPKCRKTAGRTRKILKKVGFC